MSDALSECAAALVSLNATLAEAQAALSAAEAPAEDPCVEPLAAYDTRLHIEALFIVLAASCLGVLVTLAGKRCAALRLPPLAMALGKTVGTGVILAVALIHMLQPAAVALASPCVPTAFNTDYQAYAYLFAMLAALAMQGLEDAAAGGCARGAAPQAPPPPLRSPSDGADAAPVCAVVDCPAEPVLGSELVVSGGSAGAGAGAGGRLGAAGAAALRGGDGEPLGDEGSDGVSGHGGGHGHGHSRNLGARWGHSHGGGNVGGGVGDAQTRAQTLLGALLAEFGFTTHSVFIGLAVGVVGDEDLRALLVALCFHQFFEGVALGARLTEAGFSTTADAAFAIVFGVSAPLGIGVGVGLASGGGLSTAGGTFLLLQGCFDGICAGILLHIGFCLLLRDFPRDVQRHCAAGAGAAGKAGEGKRAFPAVRRAAMYAALWGGAGFMAVVGKYL